MSKRFGRNQKRKLKEEINNLQRDVSFFSSRLDYELSNPRLVSNVEQFYVYENPVVHYRDSRFRDETVNVETHLLHTLEHEQSRDYVDPRMLVLKYHLHNDSVAWKYSEETLRKMDKQSLKHYITQHMADMLVNTLQKER